MKNEALTKGACGRLKIICCLCATAALFMGCDTIFKKENKKTVIVVGSRHVTTSQLKNDIVYMSEGIDTKHRNHREIKKQLIDRLIDNYLIIEYGKQHNISVSEQEIQSAYEGVRKGYTDERFKDALLRGYTDLGQWMKRLEEQLLLNKIIKTVSDRIVLPSHEEIEAYYRNHQDEFRFSKMVEFRQVVTRTKGEAEKVLKRLNGGDKMSSLAQEYSTAPEAVNGGKVGWIEQGCLDESMEKVLFSLPVGGHSTVVKTPYGYHIFEVLAVRPEGVRPLREVLAEIEAKTVSRRRAAALSKWLEELRKNIVVKIDKKLLNAMELS